MKASTVLVITTLITRVPHIYMVQYMAKKEVAVPDRNTGVPPVCQYVIYHTLANFPRT